jgi:hypothetical protein
MTETCVSLLLASSLLKNSFRPQLDSVLNSVGFCCVHGFDLTHRTFSAACWLALHPRTLDRAEIVPRPAISLC